MIQPIVTKNSIPFLVNKHKVKNLSHYLDKTEPYVDIPACYIQNTLNKKSEIEDLEESFDSESS